MISRSSIQVGASVALVIFSIACSRDSAVLPPGRVYTVSGPMPSQDLGLTLTHEHIMSNFGRPMSEFAAYDRGALLDQVVPYLLRLKTEGVQSIFDCTTAYFGRRVDLLQLIADTTGLHIITNTGFYGAANDRYIPDQCHRLSITEIAEIWIGEFKSGIGGTDVRPGFIKLAFDHGPPSEIDLKLFEAGCISHQATGLTLAVHTGDNPEAVQAQLETMSRYSIDFSNWIWVHANKSKEDEMLLNVARQGGWISLDGVMTDNVAQYIQRLSRFKENGLLNRVLLSHDGNGFPGGKAIRPFEALLTTLIPMLLEAGFNKQEIDLLVKLNPAAAFSLN